MKKLKVSKDLFAIFYIVNWILSIIIAPLGGYAVIVLMLSTIEFLSSGKTSILMQFMMFSMIFKCVVLIYLFIYLILSFRSLIQSIKTSKDSLYLAPISLILTLLLQLFPFISALKDTRTIDRGCATMLDFVFPQLSLRSVWIQRTKKEGTALGRACG